MSARRIFLVARQAFVEHASGRVFYGVVAYAALLAIAAAVAGPLSAGEDVKIIKDLGLALIELAGALMAVVVGAGLVGREADRRSILSLLPKPLPRWEFIVGKYVGLLMIILAGVALMSLALLGVLLVLNWQASPAARAAWGTAAVDPRLAVAVLMITGELALLSAVAVFFSVLSSSLSAALVMTVGVFVAGQLSADLRSFGQVADVPAWASFVMAVIGWVLPAFSSFDVKAAVVHGDPLPGSVVPLTLTYGAVYSIGLIAGTVALFSRREFR